MGTQAPVWPRAAGATGSSCLAWSPPLHAPGLPGPLPGELLEEGQGNWLEEQDLHTQVEASGRCLPAQPGPG